MRIKDHLVLRCVGEKYMIIDPGKGLVDLTYVYALNKTAARLWDQLKGIEFTIETIVKLLESNYSIMPDQAQHDAVLFLVHMNENHLLETVNNESING